VSSKVRKVELFVLMKYLSGVDLDKLSNTHMN